MIPTAIANMIAKSFAHTIFAASALHAVMMNPTYFLGGSGKPAPIDAAKLAIEYANAVMEQMK